MIGAGEVHGEFKVPRGKLVVIDLDVEDGRLRDVRLTGDFFLYPEESLIPIVNALDGAPAGLPAHEYTLRVAEAVPTSTEMFGLSPAAVAIAVARAQETQNDE